MNMQTPIRLTGILPQCVCGRLPKAYCTEGKEYHLECFPCRITTVRLSSVDAAKMEFRRVVAVKSVDNAASRPALRVAQ